MATNFAPTAEQMACVEAAVTGEDMVIDAGAGAGKTSTLRLIADWLAPKKGLYVAYNKAIQEDAKASFPANVECRTAHSLAYGWTMRQKDGKALIAKMRTNSRVPSWQAAKTMGIPSQGFYYGDEVGMSQRACATAAMTTVARFCNSASSTITERHVPREFEGGAQEAFAAFLLRYAKWAWEDIKSPRGKLRFIPDHYLKLWALSNPTLKGDFILFDEAQDANPCIAKVIEAQKAQKIFVGDRCQAIYGWRGAIDAMSNFNAPHKLVLSESFRFGPAVAAQANRWLDLLDAPLRITGSGPESTVETLDDPDAVLCRTNAGAVETAMQMQAAGKSVALVGGTKEIERFVKAAGNMMNGKKVEHEDLIAFDSWADVVAHSREDEGRDLRVMVNLVETYGVEAILDICSASVDEDAADVVISTAHKAKGREWDRVQIGMDFSLRAPEDGETYPRAEAMLAYVAVTRARKVLDYAGLAWLDGVSVVLGA